MEKACSNGSVNRAHGPAPAPPAGGSVEPLDKAFMAWPFLNVRASVAGVFEGSVNKGRFNDRKTTIQ
jgi:hypothetical protein